MPTTTGCCRSDGAAMSDTDPIRVREGEIPLPPQEMWGALDNSGGAEPTIETPPRQKIARPAPEVAQLTFVGEAKPFREVRLLFPFLWEGSRVDVITVQRLTVHQLGAFFDTLPEDGGYDRMEVYGLMCGLPAAVLRALPDADGTRVTGACFDFLPPQLGGTPPG